MSLGKKATIHQLTTMLSTASARAITKVKGRQYQWLTGGYDLEIGLF